MREFRALGLRRRRERERERESPHTLLVTSTRGTLVKTSGVHTDGAADVAGGREGGREGEREGAERKERGGGGGGGRGRWGGPRVWRERGWEKGGEGDEGEAVSFFALCVYVGAGRLYWGFQKR